MVHKFLATFGLICYGGVILLPVLGIAAVLCVQPIPEDESVWALKVFGAVVTVIYWYSLRWNAWRVYDTGRNDLWVWVDRARDYVIGPKTYAIRRAIYSLERAMYLVRAPWGRGFGRETAIATFEEYSAHYETFIVKNSAVPESY